MNGDFSRNTFDPARHYSSVRLQQGRVVTDADWNEQADLTRHRIEVEAKDVIGGCGAPLAGAGFRLTAATNAIAVRATSSVEAWIAAEDGALLHTVDGGSTWSLTDVHTGAHLNAVDIDAGVGWIAGDRGTLRKTVDNGATWTAQDAGTGADLLAIVRLDATHAWAVGEGGIAVATSDGGASWLRAQTDATRLQAVRFFDALNGVAVGRGGTIVGTSNGGQTWSRRAGPAGMIAHLRALATAGTSLACAAGERGTIIRSTDGGATWSMASIAGTPVTATLRAIAFVTATEGWAAGDGGALLHTTDGGLTWSALASGTTARLRALCASPNGVDCWVAGDRSTAMIVSSASPSRVPRPLPAFNLAIEAGRLYVGGVACELEAATSYVHQVDGGAGSRLGPGSYLMYLQAWQRHLTAIEAPPIREVALGGPDTATRSRTIAQVRALPLPPPGATPWNCDSKIPGWEALVHAPQPRLAARAEPQVAATSLCDIASTAGYRRLENQLYRVEVHAGGAAPTFKWSRENGSVAFRVQSVVVDSGTSTTTVRLAARGRDANLDLAFHDRVELVDDETALTTRTGALFEYIADGDDALEIVLDGIAGASIGNDAGAHPMLRRWEQRPVAGTHALPIVEGTWLELEDGVQIRFEPGGHYRPGDYWQIPARTITADVEWPSDDDGDPVARPPAGLADRYCRLGIVEVAANGQVAVRTDCRNLFPPLTSLAQLLYVSGDGQDAAPGAVVPKLLEVRVARGSVPCPGVTVRFVAESGTGMLSGGGNTGLTVDVATGADGHAACGWTLGPSALPPGRFQSVRATLLDEDRQPEPGQSIVFCATASWTMSYVTGDGQEAAAGTNVPFPLELRVANGAEGIPGASVRFSVQGGGSLIGAAVTTTDAAGMASIGWRLGGAGAQRVNAELMDAGGQVLQRLSYNATIVAPGGAKTGCEVSIGNGGQFERLDSELLKRLLVEGRGSACICFMPGLHDITDLELDGSQKFRLVLHGCGHTAQLRLRKGIALSGFISLEIRDLVLQTEGELGVILKSNAEVTVEGVQFDRRGDVVRAPWLRIFGTQRATVSECVVEGTPKGSAVAFDEIAGDCHVARNRVTGSVSFYGDPAPANAAQTLLDKLLNAPALRLSAKSGHLFFADNTVSQLAISERMAAQLMGLVAEGLFETGALQGNAIGDNDNVFVSGRLSYTANDLTGVPADQLYGLLIANRATATGNLAAAVGDHAILHFIPKGNLAQAANQVFIANP